jgi:bifunctional non-homologous end joining protein LigD
MTLKRYPDGSTGPFFYEKQAPSHTPSWVRRAPIESDSKGKPINYVVVDNLATLVWLANLAALELHPLLARYPDVHRPTQVVFDLDPGPPAGIVQCAEVALALREMFEAFSLQLFAKTSGSKGMQLYVPLNSEVTYDETKEFARAVARILERENPRRVVSSMSKALRTGKVFIDWSQNHDTKTTIAVYSLRARERPFVSTPVTWDEIEEAVAKKDGAGLSFEAPEVLERVAKMGDLFAPLLTVEQTLPGLAGNGAGRAGS